MRGGGGEKETPNSIFRTHVQEFFKTISHDVGEEKNADLMTAFQESVEPQEFSTEMDEDNNSDAAYAGKTVDILGSSMQMTGCWILIRHASPFMREFSASWQFFKKKCDLQCCCMS